MEAKKIELEINGEIKHVAINEKVTALTLFNLQKEGAIDGTFLKEFMKAEEKEMGLDPVAILQAVYAAYRQANTKDYLEFEDFLSSYHLDLETDIEIYFAVISKEVRKGFQDNFTKGIKGKKQGK